MPRFLETERLILRYITEADADNLFQLDSDPEVMRFISGGKTTDYEAIKNKLLPLFIGYYQKYGQLAAWAVEEKISQNFIGWFIFRPASEFKWAKELNLASKEEIELGYRLCRTSWGKGYATEGSKALIHKGFKELNVKKVCAFALANNKASTRVMEKVGLKLEKEFQFTEAQFPCFQEADRKALKYSLREAEFLD
ncbi:GNAT family N-acetyltransferase [Gloeothece verrucosa]|uniref:GCN5-related N-acetyltransferase n=1 Tax=Gloeothece verrucosa (strain PCC 7822) TaxID=497965 RepID=E0U900_GLOV7|nr:GNAT family N-acetyltransferase [Gloeothece verrucosa]ADN16139.1 GCN5-related N-acetyltransferase [Gloeothece verrucosa PCC 7822]